MTPSSDPGEATAAGFVLAGGQSKRMGRDKALVEFQGKPLIAHAVEILQQAGLEASIAGARSPLQTYAPVIADEGPERGPLTGICAALRSTSATRAVFLPVDLPLLPSALIRYLLFHASITGAAVTLISLNGFPQTFPVVLEVSILDVLERQLSTGSSGCYNAFAAASRERGESIAVLPLEYLVQSGAVLHPAALPAFQWFLNVNAPADLENLLRA